MIVYVYAIEPSIKVTNNSMEQAQIADQTDELLGKTRVSRQFWPLVFCRTRTMPNPAHTTRRQRGVETTKVAPSPMQCLLHIFLNFPSQTKRKKQ